MDIWSVFEYTAMATVVGLLVWFIKLLFYDKLDARWHYFIWLVLLARLMIPAGVAYIRTPWSVFQELPVEKWSAMGRILVRENGDEALFSILGRIYLWGVLLLGGYYLLTWLVLRIQIAQAPKADAVTRKYVEDIGAKYGLKSCRDVRICKSNTPYICGVIYPVLVLPEDNVRAQEPVIVHELLHKKYKDVLLNIIIRVVRAVNWFNPILWLLTGVVQNDNEALCDQRVLEHCRECSEQAYGEMLIEMSEKRRVNIAKAGTSRLAGTYRNMKTRICRIRDFGRVPAGIGIATLCITLMLATAVVGSMEVYGFELPELATERNLKRALLEAQCYQAHTPEEAVYLFLLSVTEHNPIYRMAVIPREETELFQEFTKRWFDRRDAAWADLEAGMPENCPVWFPRETSILRAAVVNLQSDGEKGNAVVYADVVFWEEKVHVEWRLSLEKEDGWIVRLDSETDRIVGEYRPEPLLYGSTRMGDYLVEGCLYNEGWFEHFRMAGVSRDPAAAFPIGFSMEYKWQEVGLTYLGEESLTGRQIKVVISREDAEQTEKEAGEVLEQIRSDFEARALKMGDYTGSYIGHREGVFTFDGGRLLTGERLSIYGGGAGSGRWKSDEKVKIYVRIYVDGVIVEEGELWSEKL